IILKTFLFEHHTYIEYAHDIYYCVNQTPDDILPKLLTINNKRYTRFLDFIYMPCETYELSAEQCIAVNDIRNLYFQTHKNISINHTVKQKFTTLINTLCTNRKMTLLEYGCGYQAIYELLNPNICYIGVDINEKVIASHNKPSLNSKFFLVDQNHIPISNHTINFIVSIFVFHFSVNIQQLSKLFNLLIEDGVMIFNLYLLPKDQRQILFSNIRKIGFSYHRLPDSEQLCQDHEYCVLTKNSNSFLFKETIELLYTTNSIKSDQTSSRTQAPKTVII
ncbi:MAG TPA: methyltransferase domain-containing protein, partial [Legionellaceae bacterium]|nr:methyltransferase domain-containing protein [Legionellaceae bacterium]